MDEYILHCDMNNYFASVEMIDNPYLENIPLVVCGDIELRHGIVLSKNNKAKEYGIVTGESVFEAKKKFHDVVCVTADYKKYLKYTKASRAIYQRYSSNIIPYGLDEAWINISKCCSCLEDAIKIAREIKKAIKDELKLNIAVGLSFNYVFAKLGSDQKSNDIFVIDKPNFINITEYFPAFSLLFVGSKTRSKLKKLNILTIGDLRKTDPKFLEMQFGKKGVMLYEFANGDDSNFKPIIESDEEIKSISNTITSPKDIYNQKETEAFIYLLSDAVSKRLIKHKLSGKTIALKIKLNDFKSLNKQITLDKYVDQTSDIFVGARNILNDFDYVLPIRSISLRISNLSTLQYTQLSLFDSENIHMSDKLAEKLHQKYGNFGIEQTSTSKDWEE